MGSKGYWPYIADNGAEYRVLIPIEWHGAGLGINWVGGERPDLPNLPKTLVMRQMHLVSDDGKRRRNWPSSNEACMLSGMRGNGIVLANTNGTTTTWYARGYTGERTLGRTVKRKW